MGSSGCISLLGGSSQDLVQWLGSPAFISHFHGHLEGVPQPDPLGTTTITMVINHLLNGMTLQVDIQSYLLSLGVWSVYLEGPNTEAQQVALDVLGYVFLNCIWGGLVSKIICSRYTATRTCILYLHCFFEMGRQHTQCVFCWNQQISRNQDMWS